MLLNATLHSKYFQGGGKRMLFSYLLISCQAIFSTGRIFKMKGEQIGSFFPVHYKHNPIVNVLFAVSKYSTVNI